MIFIFLNILATFLKDLTFIMEGNPTFLPTGHQREKQFRMTTTTTVSSKNIENDLSEKNDKDELLELSIKVKEAPTPTETTTHPNISQSLINFDKFRLLTKNVYTITRYTSRSYPFEGQLSLQTITNNNNFIIVENSSTNNKNSSNVNPTLLDYIGEVIEKRLFEAAGAMFGGNVASIAMSDGGELEAELMALSLEAEPTAASLQHQSS